MPELPEAEVVLDHLRRNILGGTISELRIERQDIIRAGLSFSQWYTGSQVQDISRFGKSLVLSCVKNTTTRYLLAELGMTGLFLFPGSADGKAKHIHVAFSLEHASISHLYYWNPRRFGRVYLFDLPQLEQFLARRFGVDPLTMTPETFFRLIGQSRGRVKALLLDQHKVAGIGNIYANEILYRAKIHPHAKGFHLTQPSLTRLYQSIQTVLREAIVSGGSTIRDFCAPDGTSGRYQERHIVYQKAGTPCPRGCPTLIRRLMTERSSFFCPRCQRRI